MTSNDGGRKSAVQSYLDVDFTFIGLWMELLSPGCDLDAEPLHDLPADVLLHRLEFLKHYRFMATSSGETRPSKSARCSTSGALPSKSGSRAAVDRRSRA